MSIEEQVNKVRSSLAAYPQVKVVAATKYMTIDQVKELYNNGIKEFGENRSQLLCEKYAALTNYPDIRWHFLGTLQTRKVKDVIDKIDVLHSLDSLKLALEINKRAHKIIDCFIEVNISGEDNKGGLRPPFIDHIQELIEGCATLEHIRIVGLMCVAENTVDEEKIRSSFREMKELRDYFSQKNYPQAPCLGLSMGMSHDYLLAVEEGATIVRIGRLFLEKSEDS